MSGSSREFQISGGPWSDVLWIHKLGAHNDKSHFLWDFNVYFDSDSAANAHAAEYDLWQTIGGTEFMIGSQCVFDDNEWDLWDSSINQWVNSGLPCPRFTPNTWHHIAWDVERVGPNQYRYNTLFVDDQVIPIGKTFTTNPIDWEDNVGVQWQLDQDGQGHPIKEWVDNVKLTMW